MTVSFLTTAPRWRSVLRCAFLMCFVAGSVGSTGANANGDDEKKAKSAEKKKAQEDPFGDLFGAPAATGGLDSLKAATQGVQKSDNNNALKPKAAKIRDGSNVSFPMLFAAERIRIDRKKGCVPATRKMIRIKEFQFSQLPAQTIPFSVCLRIASDAGRLMRMSVAMVGPRMKRVAHAESVADFTGKDELDHILDWPALQLPAPGVYHYVVDLDGKRVAKIPVFEVKVGEADGIVEAPAATP